MSQGRTWTRGKLVRRKHTDGNWCLEIEGGRAVFLLPKTRTFSAEEMAHYGRLVFGKRVWDA